MVLDTFKRFISDENLIEKGDGIVIALSGGADSVFMTEMLLEVKDEMDISLVCVHLNHLFRGEDANRDEEFCREFCANREIPYVSKRLDIESMAKEEKQPFEAIGRRERYRLFEEVRLMYNFDKIAVAQNLNDQGETLLLHLFRGAGLSGLTGIHPKRDKIIRPILSIARDELEIYLQNNKITYCNDHTNALEMYSRNYVRLNLLKGVRDRINPGVDRALFNTASLIKCDEDFLNEHVSVVFDSLVRSDEKEWLINQEDWKKLHLSIKRRLIRKIIKDFTGNLINIHHYIIDEIIELCNNGMTGKLKPVNEEITFSIKYGDIVVSSGIYEKTFIDRRGLHIDIGSIEDLERKKHECDVFIDYDCVEEQLSVRNRRNGDRFRPFGMKGTKKLKNHFIDLKIPKEERDSIPLICDGDSIVWIVGIGIDDQYKVNGDTKRVAFLSYR